MTIRDSERRVLIEYRIEKAKKTVEDVRFLIASDRLHIAANRIYYSAFYMLSALAMQYRFPTAKHGQLIGWFNQHFIKTERIDKTHGQFLHKAYDKRSKSDYADFIEFHTEEIQKMLTELESFIAAVETLIKVPTK